MSQNKKISMRPVSIIGVGCTPFGKSDSSIIDLAIQSSVEAINSANVKYDDIQSIYLGNFVGERLANQGSLGAMLADRLDISDIPATKTEGACASGGIAFRHAFLTIALGLYDFVLATGVEKMTSSSTPDVTAALATAGDMEMEMYAGLTFPGAFAMIMASHMQKYGTTREQIASVSVKNHRNGTNNPKAMFQKEINVEDVITSREISEPIRLFDCPPISDGAASVLLCPTEIAKNFVNNPVNILGSGHASGPISLSGMKDLTSFSATAIAANEAYAMSGLRAKDIDVIEVHDCFSIAEIIALEDLGFFNKGEGGPATESGITALNGKYPTNPSGGLIAKGHPVGATGIAQIYELTKQLQGLSTNQTNDPETALAHNLGGLGALSTVHILGKTNGTK